MKIKDKIAQFQQQATNAVRPKVRRLSDRLRIPARIRLANRWGAKHPKRVFAISFTTVFCLMVGSIASDFYSFAKSRNAKTESPSLISDIPSIQSITDYNNHINDQKSVSRHIVGEIGNTGLRLKAELDSLMDLPVKTHEDSLQIVNKYRRLERYVDIIMKKGSQDESKN